MNDTKLQINSLQTIYLKLHLKYKNFAKLEGNLGYLKFLHLYQEFEEISQAAHDSITIVKFNNYNQAGNSIEYLTNAKYKTLQLLNEKYNLREKLSPTELYDLILEELDKAIAYTVEYINNFTNNIKELLKNVYRIYTVYDIETFIEDVKLDYQHFLKNQVNLRKSLIRKTIKSFYTRYYNRLIQKLESLSLKGIKRYQNTIEIMSLSSSDQNFEDAEINTEIIQNRLNDELKKQKECLEIKESEIIELKHELFADETDPKVQKKRVKEIIETKEKDLKLRIRSIQALETTIEEMQQQANKLTEQKLLAEERLSKKKCEMFGELRKLLELEQLILEINDEIRNIYNQFQNRIAGQQARRLQVLNDPNLTEEERKNLLEQIDNEIKITKEECASILTSLTVQADELGRIAKEFAKHLEQSKNDLIEKHRQELEELENMKIGASPSALLQIEAKIRDLNRTYEENLEMIERSMKRPQYQTDEFGRYFMSDGIRIYQRHSNASQYVRLEDGTWQKIAEERKLYFDDDGEYYIDASGEKVYTKQMHEDEHGRYYLNANGERVYKRGPNTSEYMLIDGVLVKVAERVKLDKSASKATLTSLDLHRIEDQEYIKKELGTALRIALASITVHQPADPINYLANFLLEYRYNQFIKCRKEKELQDLMDERQRFREEEDMHNLQKCKEKLEKRPKDKPIFPHCSPCPE